MSIEEINVAAFLRLIRYAEHQSDDDNVYFLLHGGQQNFTDTSHHPNKAVTTGGHTSTAAGAYQIGYGSWKDARDKGVVTDFTKASQDKLAINKLRCRHALAYIEAGDIDRAIPLLRNEWTSMPGAKQSAMSISMARELFNKYVVELFEK